jgi:hypothetical protein
MKTALAFVCSLMLAWTCIVPAQAPDAGVARTVASCHCGKKTSCCAAKQSPPESSPVSTAPAASFQNQFSLIAAAMVAWTLPEIPARELSSPSFSPFVTASAPLFERNCAWLI